MDAPKWLAERIRLRQREGGGAIDSLTSSRKSVHDRRKKVRGTEDIGEWYIYRK